MQAEGFAWYIRPKCRCGPLATSPEVLLGMQARAAKASAGSRPVIVRNAGGGGSKDLQLENFSVSNGGAELIEVPKHSSPPFPCLTHVVLFTVLVRIPSCSACWQAVANGKREGVCGERERGLEVSMGQISQACCPVGKESSWCKLQTSQWLN